jgi:hypothetical protein
MKNLKQRKTGSVGPSNPPPEGLIFIVLLIAVGACCRADSPEAGSGYRIGQPCIFWRHNEWQTYRNGAWIPYGQTESASPDTRDPAKGSTSDRTTTGMGQPNAGIGSPTIGIGEQPPGIGQPIVIGQPAAGMGQPNAIIGQPTIGMGRPNAAIGQPTIGMGQSAARMGQPSGGIGQTTIGMGRPLEMGQPTIGIGKPAMETPKSRRGIEKPAAIKAERPSPGRHSDHPRREADKDEHRPATRGRPQS